MVLSSTIITFNDIKVDTINQTLALPLDMVESLRQKLRSMARRNEATPREVQSLTGSLNFACRAIAPGRCFLRRILDLTSAKTRANHRIRLIVGARRDISV